MNKIISLKKISYFVVVFLLSTLSTWAQCAAPTAVTLSAITQAGVTVSWTPSPDASAGNEIEIRTSGAAGSGAAGLAFTYVESNPTTAVITGLQPLTQYVIYVRAKCSNPASSGWAASSPFNTIQLPAPTALLGSDPTSESFVAKWTNVAGAVNYELSFSEDGSFLVPSTISTELVGNHNVKLVIDLEASTPYFYRVRARSASGDYSPYSNIESITTGAVQATFAKWTGTYWTAQPTLSKDLIIDGDFVSSLDAYGTALNGKSLQLNLGKKFTLSAGTFAIILQGINNLSAAGDFIVESGANLKQEGSSANQGAITVKRNSFPIYRLDYTMWSSPVENQNLFTFSNQTIPSRFYNYDSENNIFVTVDNVQGTTFNAGQGYLVRAPNTWPNYNVEAPVAGTKFVGTFVGKPHNGIQSIPVVPGFNMVGNPYPTDIKAAAVYGAPNSDVIEPKMWFWRRRNNDGTGPTSSFYATFSSLGGTATSGIVLCDGCDENLSTRPTGNIKVGQGFMVKVKTNVVNPSLIFNSSMKRESVQTDVFLRQEDVTVEQHKFYLNMTGANGIFSQILLGFAADASNDIDNNDAEYIGDSPIALSSLLEETAYTIQAKALPFSPSQNFLLRFQTSVAGAYNIALEDVTGIFENNVDPILVDMLTNTQVNLRNGSYAFASEAGIFDSRFKVSFEENALGTIDNSINSNAVAVVNNNGILSINAGSYVISNVQIYDLLGRNLYSASNVDASTTSVKNLKAQQQIILVRIATDHGVITKKVQF